MARTEQYKTNGRGHRVIRCDRCRRRNRNPSVAAGWNATLRQGVIVGYLCPGCQTPEENAEAEVNEATTDYLGTDSFGQIIGAAKGFG